eukprot:6200367-Pleurochrysis_carterae.AAC.3
MFGSLRRNGEVIFSTSALLFVFWWSAKRICGAHPRWSLFPSLPRDSAADIRIFSDNNALEKRIAGENMHRTSNSNQRLEPALGFAVWLRLAIGTSTMSGLELKDAEPR